MTALFTRRFSLLAKMNVKDVKKNECEGLQLWLCRKCSMEPSLKEPAKQVPTIHNKQCRTVDDLADL